MSLLSLLPISSNFVSGGFSSFSHLHFFFFLLQCTSVVIFYQTAEKDYVGGSANDVDDFNDYHDPELLCDIPYIQQYGDQLDDRHFPPMRLSGDVPEIGNVRTVLICWSTIAVWIKWWKNRGRRGGLANCLILPKWTGCTSVASNSRVPSTFRRTLAAVRENLKFGVARKSWWRNWVSEQ